MEDLRPTTPHWHAPLQDAWRCLVKGKGKEEGQEGIDFETVQSKVLGGSPELEGTLACHWQWGCESRQSPLCYFGAEKKVSQCLGHGPARQQQPPGATARIS